LNGKQGGAKTNRKIVLAIFAIVITLAGITGYIYLSQSTQTAQETVTLKGKGATFPYPLLSEMIAEYQKNHTNVQINYGSLGSGAGISALEQKTVDFAASDAPLSANDAAQAPNSLHIPETIGSVTVAYNLPGVPTGLHLTGKIVADIFSGTVKTWNDSEIQSLNPNVNLPANAILVVHRSDGSGTTFIFTGYLSASSSAWNSSIGQGKTVGWPVGIGAYYNPGVAGVVQGTPYTIGYVELTYVLQNNLTVAAIQNPAGNWILPTLNTTQSAVQSGSSSGLPAGNESWAKVNLLNAPDPQAYPIVSFTYLLVYKELNVTSGITQAKATALVKFLWWVIQSDGGQQYAPGLDYAQLQPNVITIDEATIQSITFNGQHLPTS
jgi:phosphate transport system substrate-binding protein